jgi:isoquinoline 1-oxidoreductase subunit beta
MTRARASDRELSRRKVIIGVAASGALLVGGFIGTKYVRRRIAGKLVEDDWTLQGSQSGAAKPDLWFEVPPAGPIVLYSPNVEMGQGIHTALAQLAAEELELRWDQIQVRPTPSVHGGGLKPRGFGSLSRTAGSRSIASAFGPLRSSAAMLREILLIEGASQLGLTRAEVAALEGTVIRKSNPSVHISFGDVVAKRNAAFSSWERPPTTPILKQPDAFTVIGRPFRRVDADSKVRGLAAYGYDATVPGTVFGAVAQPPRYGARLDSGTAGAAAQMPGVLKVVIDPKSNFAAVVASTRTQAHAALGALQLDWEGGSTTNDAQIDTQLRRADGTVVHKAGNVDHVLGSALRTIRAEYRTPAAAHAHLEPIAALADVRSDAVEVWAATQQPDTVAKQVSAALQKRRPVTVHPTYLGGGFGRKFLVSSAPDAARLSEAVGKPVHVGWTREQDMRHGPFRPPSISLLEGAVGSDGRILAIDQHSHIARTTPIVPGLLLDMLGFDPTGLNGQVLPYGIEHYRVRSHVAEVGIPTGIWRGVGLLPNVFAVESFIDELAHHAGQDPLQFRLNNLPTSGVPGKFRPLLETLRTRADWTGHLEPGRGRGVALSVMAGTCVATVVQATVTDRRIAVERVFVCADPGLVINPDGARLQIAGAVMMGLSSALFEKVTFRNGMAEQSNFDDYPILSAADAPPVDVHLMGTGDVPAGLGEPGIGPVAAALGNALFVATGQRLRVLPFDLSAA